MKVAGYVCPWQGCKVFIKRSSSLQWLERHVISHCTSKPFKCVLPGCGLLFNSRKALQDHVNCHITTNGSTNGSEGKSKAANKKNNGSPTKTSRRRRNRHRRQMVNIGVGEDYFDKRVMEVIKHRISSSVDRFAVNPHECTFRGDIIARRVIAHCERDVLVRWHPRFIFPDEWVPESKFSSIKLVPLRQIPTNKIRLLYPSMFPPLQHKKGLRKRKAVSNTPPSMTRPMSTNLVSGASSSFSTIPPSPPEFPSFTDVDPFAATIRKTRSSSSFSTALTTVGPKAGRKSSPQKKKGFSSNPLTSCLANVKRENNPEDDKQTSSFDSSHWALEVLYEDLGIFS